MKPTATPMQRTYRWALTALCLTLALTFIASRWWGMLWINRAPYFGIGILPGQLVCGRDGQPRPEFEVFRQHTEGRPWAWWFDFEVNTNTFLVIIPLWLPVLITAIPTAYAWRRHLRAAPGHCAKCGYSLAGIASSVCPECGTTVCKRAVLINGALKS